MQRVILPGTEIAVSRFAFGTASLHHLGGLSVQADHLLAAADAGFSHFDTAPLYGFGEAERAIGSAFGRPKGADVSIATKVGLYPPGGTSQPRTAVLARKVIGRLAPALSSARPDWAVTRARQSLDLSLRRLHRDRIEFLLLHEPDIGVLDTDIWLRWLEDEVTAGRVGAFGLAGASRQLLDFVAKDNPLGGLVQTLDSVEGREADFMASFGRTPQITYGYLSAAKAAGTRNNLLAGALARNRTGAILVSTRSRERLPAFAAAVEIDSNIKVTEQC